MNLVRNLGHRLGLYHSSPENNSENLEKVNQISQNIITGDQNHYEPQPPSLSSRFLSLITTKKTDEEIQKAKEEFEQREDEFLNPDKYSEGHILELIPDVEGADVLNFFADTSIGKFCVNNSKFVRDSVKKALLGKTDFEAVIKKQRDELISLDGNSNLADVIEAFSPKVSQVVQEEIAGDPSKKKVNDEARFPGFSTWMNKENNYFQSIIKSIFYKVVVNFAKHTKIQIVSEKGEFKSEIGSELVKELMKIAFEEFDAIEEDFLRIELMESEKEKKEKFYELLQPAVVKFLKIALPRGKEDLELADGVSIIPCKGVSSAVWEVVSKELVPEILLQSIRLVKKPPHHTNEDLEILDRPGGAALKRIAKFIGEQCKDIAPKVIAEKSLSISEGVVETLVKDHTKHGEITPWLSLRIAEFASSEDLVVKKIWSYSASNIESIFLHAFASMGKDADGNLLPMIGNKGLSLVEDFFTEQKETLEREFAASGSLSLKEKEKYRANLFMPLVNTILEKSNLDKNPLVLIVKDSLFPEILRQIYEDMIEFGSNQASYKERLVKKIFDPVAFANQNALNSTRGFAQSLEDSEMTLNEAHENSGVNKIADDLLTACGILSEDIIRIVREFAENDHEIFADLVDRSIFEDYKLSDAEKREFGDGIHEFMYGSSENLNNSWEYGKRILEKTLFKVLTTVAEKTEIDGKEHRKVNKNEMLASNVIHRILSILSTKIPVIDTQLEVIEKSEKCLKEKRVEIYKLFEPLAIEFLNLAGDHVEEVFPVPNFLKDGLKEKLKTLFLPAIFYEVYTDLNALRVKIPEEKENLKNIFSSEAPNHAINVVADYIKQFVPYYMETSPEKITAIFERVGGKYFNVLSEDQKVSVKKLLNKNISVLGLDPAVKDMSSALAEYSKGMMSRIMRGLFENIHAQENQPHEDGSKNNFLLTTTIALIKVSGSYFRRVNKIPPEERNYPAYVVPHKVMLKGFIDSNEIHEALKLDIDPNATEEEKRQQRLDSFFVQSIAGILEISGFNDPKDFPAPSFIREFLWKVFKETILPEVTLDVVQDGLKPANINELLLKVIDSLTSEVDGFNAELDKNNIDMSDDPHQKELNAALGELIREMINLVPESITKVIFKSNKINKMTSEAIGNALRKRLDNKTMIQYIESGLSSFSLKKPDADRGKSTSRILKENRLKEKELNKKMTSYISKQLQETFKVFIKNKWQAFQKSYNELILKLFGKPGLAVKKFFDKILHFIFFDFLGPVFKFIMFKVLWFFVDLKIASKTKEIIRDTHMPIHENLIYKFCDIWVEILKGKKKPADIEEDIINEAKHAKSNKPEESTAESQTEEGNPLETDQEMNDPIPEEEESDKVQTQLS